jgi:hypothetical protein
VVGVVHLQPPRPTDDDAHQDPQKANTPFKNVLRRYALSRIALVYFSVYTRTGKMMMTRLEGYYKYYFLYKSHRLHSLQNYLKITLQRRQTYGCLYK